MKLKENLALSKSGFLFDPQTGESFNLNPTGRVIFEMLSAGKSESEIMEILSETYDIDAARLQRHLDDFLMMLRRFNLTDEEES
ncbi:hypothetical protein Ctha_1894 [Chloroherpeton thalassium ATCC 35110]|uniref:Coenzyme PQQ synthesis D n=1 Tax=Chloroherpeton thalassium (strain ATCC 35110 / GB-78) TaxID=517418 RepID=B3QUA1_CHLT3|nr:PqqD family protein [Chloroherpeton thalassium]ACF14350.1 hypothetical protein Ctha_1894 [Chloroherpeton thalassium ATCC 35110]